MWMCVSLSLHVCVHVPLSACGGPEDNLGCCFSEEPSTFSWDVALSGLSITKVLQAGQGVPEIYLSVFSVLRLLLMSSCLTGCLFFKIYFLITCLPEPEEGVRSPGAGVTVVVNYPLEDLGNVGSSARAVSMSSWLGGHFFQPLHPDLTHTLRSP